jgi:hypothetical protein
MRLEELRNQDFRNYKAELINADERIKKQELENKLLQIHHKEKIKELSLTELKIKELQRQVPHQRLPKINNLSKRLSVDAVPSRYVNGADY